MDFKIFINKLHSFMSSPFPFIYNLLLTDSEKPFIYLIS